MKIHINTVQGEPLMVRVLEPPIAQLMIEPLMDLNSSTSSEAPQRGQSGDSRGTSISSILSSGSGTGMVRRSNRPSPARRPDFVGAGFVLPLENGAVARFDARLLLQTDILCLEHLHPAATAASPAPPDPRRSRIPNC